MSDGAEVRTRTRADRSRAATLRALVRACHPGPTIVVTALTTLLAAIAGAEPERLALVLGAVLTGQLSIGWCNDLVDAGRDRRAHRADKPVATGALAGRTVAAATATALAATVVLSLATGVRAGSVHLVTVAGGWAYDLGLKRTAVSFLPYAVAFGALPAYAVLAAGGHPPAWLVAAGGLLGMGAHLFNVLPDIEDDRATGVRGLPVVLGARTTRVTGCLLLVAAASVLVLGPPGDAGPWAWAGLATAGCLALLAATVHRDRRSRLPFTLALLVATVDVVLLTGRAASLGPAGVGH